MLNDLHECGQDRWFPPQIHKAPQNNLVAIIISRMGGPVTWTSILILLCSMTTRLTLGAGQELTTGSFVNPMEYWQTLTLEQRKCPDSSLKCPSSPNQKRIAQLESEVKVLQKRLQKTDASSAPASSPVFSLYHTDQAAKMAGSMSGAPTERDTECLHETCQTCLKGEQSIERLRQQSRPIWEDHRQRDNGSNDCTTCSDPKLFLRVLRVFNGTAAGTCDPRQNNPQISWYGRSSPIQRKVNAGSDFYTCSQ